MVKFRGKFKAMLRAKVQSGVIRLPVWMSEEAFDKLQKKLTKVDWNVKILQRYSTGTGVATYLARYLKSGPIGNSRLLSFAEVKWYFAIDLALMKEATARNKGGDLGGRHVLSSLIGTCSTTAIPECTRLWALQWQSTITDRASQSRVRDAKAEIDEENKSWQEICDRAGILEPCRCPECGKVLISHSEFQRGRSPPSISLAFGRALLKATGAA